MQIANVQGESRSPGGRHANERLRRRGLVPAVIYGHGEKPETVAVSLRDLSDALGRLQHVIQLSAGGPPQQYLIKDVQYDHLQSTPIHVDLMRVDVNERVRVKVPVDFKGDPKGVQEGGQLVIVVNDIEIECGLLQIPDSIRANIGHLGLNQALHVRELEWPQGVTPVQGPEEVVASVRAKRGEETPAAAPAEGAAAEPEVIGRQAKDKEAQAGE